MSRGPVEKISTQVLVIGSGAGGAVTAATLAEAGFSVLLTEEGPAVDTSKLATHTPKAMRLLYRNGGLSPILGASNIAFAEGRCLGGSTEVNSAFWHRIPPDTAERWRGEFQIDELQTDSLIRLYEELEGDLEIRRVPETNQPGSSEILRRGADKLGWKVVQVPRAQSGDLAGSQFAPGAKRSMSRTFIPRAVRAGTRVLADCRIMRLHHKDGRVTGASGRILTADGPVNLEIEADWVVLSAGAIQTPVLLRASWIKRNIGNSLRIHPMLKMAAQYDDQLDSHRAPLPIYQVKEFWPEITIGGSVFTPGFLAMTLSDNWRQTQGAMQDWRQMALYHAACRGTSLGKVRCFPINNEAVVRYSLSERDRMHLTLGIARLGEALFAAGARKLFPGLRRPAEINSVEECRRMAENPLPLADMSVSTVHVFSSCPMGEDRERCAVDSFGKVHGFENLRIADASIIPDSPGVNPQGTTMALALRNARHFVSTVR